MREAELLQLAERVEAATGADRTLDVVVAGMLGLPWASVGIACPRLTASLDAVLALCAEKLPGWVWGVSYPSGAFGDVTAQRPYAAEIASPGWIDDTPGCEEQQATVMATTPTLALLAAFLRALATQESAS